MLDIIIDTLIDSLKLLPFLFIAFFIIETIEHKLNKKALKLISKSGKCGPVVGSVLGVIPQCGFSVLATNLYVTRIISMGTLVAIYLSTSDEMLPILISNKADIKDILLILGIKVIVGMIFGYVIDLFIKRNDKVTYDICEDEHCGCKHENSILRSSLVHTLKTLLYILVITFIINILFTYLDKHVLSKLFLKDTLFTPFLTSLIGLIPTCGASIMMTELYLNEAISMGALIGGLLTGSGVAILVLFKSNKNKKENLQVLGLVYGIGAICGFIIELIMMIK